MRPGLQFVDWGRVFAAEGISQLCSRFGAGLGSLADATSTFMDPEPVIAARAEIEAAETITKPEMMATEAVFIMFIVAPCDPLCGPDYVVRVKDAPSYKLTVMFPCGEAEVTAQQ
jgi:hypothetical protein